MQLVDSLLLSSFHFNVFSDSLQIRSPYAPPRSVHEPLTNRWETNGLFLVGDMRIMQTKQEYSWSPEDSVP